MASNLVLGIIGHIDHGKSSFVKALNGFDGDSSALEKERGITMDLSYSNLVHKGLNIAFIDTPGHAKLLRHVIAGASGFDASVVLVDIKEGVKEQTREHLSVAAHLGISDVFVIISKVDLVQARERSQMIDAIKTDIRQLASSLGLNIASIHPFSIYEVGLKDDVLDAFVSYGKASLPKDTSGLFMMPINRAFEAKGSGTIAIGTIASGRVEKGANIMVYELGSMHKVKALQVHGQEVSSALRGERCAINLANISAKALKRGYMLGDRGFMRGFDTIDVEVDTGLINGASVRVYIGAKELSARVRVLSPSFATLTLSDVIFARYDEKILIIDGSDILPATVLAPIADPMKKRDKIELLTSLSKKDFKSAFALLAKAHWRGFGLRSSYQRFLLDANSALNIASSIEGLIVDKKELNVHTARAKEELVGKIAQIFAKNKNAIISNASLSSSLGNLSDTLINKALSTCKEMGIVEPLGSVYVGKNRGFKDARDFVKEEVHSLLRQDGLKPLAPQNMAATLQIDLALIKAALKELTSSHKVVKIAHNIYLDSKVTSSMLDTLRKEIDASGGVDYARARALFDTTRKYIIAYLEYLDRFSDIKNEGNVRKKK